MTKRFDEMADAICDLIGCDDIAFYDGDDIRCDCEETAHQISEIFRIAGINTQFAVYTNYPLEFSEYDGMVMVDVRHDIGSVYVQPAEEE